MISLYECPSPCKYSRQTLSDPLLTLFLLNYTVSLDALINDPLLSRDFRLVK